MNFLKPQSEMVQRVKGSFRGTCKKSIYMVNSNPSQINMKSP